VPMATWDPATYLQFSDERSRPFHELVNRIGAADPRCIVDLGCGPGQLTATLAVRWPSAHIQGIDSSPEMIAEARSHETDRVRFAIGDVTSWQAREPVDVLISNATLQWVPNHRTLLPHLVDALSADGWLAVQVPGNFRAPTHALLAQLCALPRWADRVGDAAPRPDAVLEPAGYFDVLTGAGLAADVWETTYLHVLTGEDPVLAWVRGTVLRPVLARLDEDDADELTEAYAAALREAYPCRPDGTTVLPFRRVFAVGRRVS
jgi:trans-aconitate 2-methyltransferase